jgi:hypothetical protein
MMLTTTIVMGQMAVEEMEFCEGGRRCLLQVEDGMQFSMQQHGIYPVINAKKPAIYC